MSKEPTIGHFLDAEEEEIYRAIEAGKYVSAKSELSPERLAELRKAARFTLNGGERTQITLRIPVNTLIKIKAMAFREGIPYKILINSILHKAVN
jgi:predicted DNA binding CopG/RHH family protein